MAKLVEKQGEKFVSNGTVLTAKSFFGNTGIEYDTAEAAKKANSTGSICVLNKEYGGATDLNKSFQYRP